MCPKIDSANIDSIFATCNVSTIKKDYTSLWHQRHNKTNGYVDYLTLWHLQCLIMYIL
jgi:hypothetical protein